MRCLSPPRDVGEERRVDEVPHLAERAAPAPARPHGAHGVAGARVPAAVEGGKLRAEPRPELRADEPVLVGEAEAVVVPQQKLP